MTATSQPDPDAAAAANRLKAEFLANVSHELRTPIHAIIGYAELLQDGIYGPLNADQEQTVQFIQDTSHDLLNLVNNLLDVARIESGRADLALHSFDLRDLIAELLREIKPLADAKNLALRSRVQVNPTIVRTDRAKLKQILLNLLGNAVKFTRHGSIILGVSAAGAATTGPGRSAHCFLITVQDTGIGIAADKLDRIFEKFYQTDSSPSRAHEGTGLGLYITKQLVDLLAAAIQVQSQPGQGTTVSLTLPVNYEELQAIQRLHRCIGAARRGPQQPSDHDRRILVVSDNLHTGRILTGVLSAANYAVQVTPASDQAASIAEKMQPLVILLDAEQSSHEFWTVFQELKLRPATRDIPTIFLGNDSHRGLGAPITVSAPLARNEILRGIRASTNAGKKKILIVDDNDTFREILKTSLEEEGYQVAEAADGVEILKQLDHLRPDLLLLDLLMPGLDGWAIIRYLARSPQLKDVQVLVITGDPLDDQQTSTLATQTSGLIQKADFKVNTMLEKVATVLGDT